MNKTLIAALALAGSLGSFALQSPALAAAGGSANHGLIATVANNRTAPSQHMTQPQPDPQTQAYPVYHDSPTATWYSPPMNRMPCHFTEAFVEGRMRQVEVCN
jgi:hypothetical protein